MHNVNNFLTLMQVSSLSQHIALDLKRRLSLAGHGAIPLTLEALSEDYHCSTRPVRSALQSLIREGILTRGHSRRLRLRRKPRLKSKSALPAMPPSVNAYPQVSRYVAELSLFADNPFVREEETAERFGITRGQLRNLFQRLNGEGILEHVPRRGWKVRKFEQKDLYDFLNVREALELKALDTAWSNLERDRLLGFLENNRPGTKSTKPKIDNGLHQYWIDLSNNHYIRNFFRQNAAYFGILFEWEDFDQQAAEQSVEHHHEILTHILKQKRSSAKKALSNHILNNHPVLESIRKSPGEILRARQPK